MQTEEYNPLDYQNLAKSIGDALMSHGPYALPPEHSFAGEGVYALFYKGPLPWYQKYSTQDASIPIYVGQASVGGRKGDVSSKPAKALHRRLKEHAESIKSTNLLVGDFSCRYLILETIWIGLAEEFLIRRYQPVWNCCIDGFGNHNPGAGRALGEITWWDALHPGRKWAQKLVQTKTQQDALLKLEAFISAS